MIYYVVNTLTGELIIGYDMPALAKIKADELNSKYNTTVYRVQ